MPRVKGGTVTRRRRKKVLKLAKGYFGSKHTLFKVAKQQVMKSGMYGGSIESITSGFIEVYTEDGETADSFIEREVFLRKGKYTNVYVVTSDGAEQNQILGSGGLRIPARELQNMIRIAKEEERLQYAHEHRRDQFSVRRNEVGGLLSPEVAEKLEKLRRGH